LIGEAAPAGKRSRRKVIDNPNVIIMDLAMPDTDGFSATAEISRVARDVAVLILTMSDDDITVTKAMRAGSLLPAQRSHQGGDGRNGSRRRRSDLRPGRHRSGDPCARSCLGHN
jgi:CheY-like chemotaxis protein